MAKGNPHLGMTPRINETIARESNLQQSQTER
jgi:hypothetical protein